MIYADKQARGTGEIASALKGIDSDSDILQRRRPWDAVACERHGKLQSAYSDDPTEPPGERPRYGKPPKDALGVWLKVESKRARCAGSRAGAETASPGCAGTVESGLCRHIPVCRHTARGPRKRVYASLEL